ncbi:MAG TPA: 5-(carboxyamino)imidazole ribonucleotide synthase [Candidatus Saccharimonadales bacterium]|nr:5-(carboxyamino)imidazole ribonucleotide synthase [Candidatus Saccharimonadales bacterium]
MNQKTLGIVGGGQLGRMLVQAAHKLKLKTIVLDPTPQSPAGQITDKQIIGNYTDKKSVRKIAKEVDYLTFEIEGANAQVLKELKTEGKQVQPLGETLEIIQDKLLQKQMLKKNNIPTPNFATINTEEDIKTAIETFKYPIVLKTRMHGFDGRGNAVIHSQADIKKALQKLKGKKLYAEQFVNFKKELAIQIAKDTKGNIKTYPVVETIQKNNICHKVIAPAQISPSVAKKATVIARKVIKNLKGAGLFGIEMFLTGKDEIIINEIAPRVHNSGHYTIEACKTSQFEQHVRAVCKLPLASTKMKVPAAVMINILGERNAKATPAGIEKAQKVNGVFVHIYGKGETKIERKMGHITALGKTIKEANQKAEAARKAITI